MDFGPTALFLQDKSRSGQLDLCARWLPLKDPDEYFRLLELLPSTQPNDPVRGIVTAYRRDEAPSYRPVSYTWGEEQAASKILLKNLRDHDWQHLSITPNLETLLKQFRNSLDMERVTIWVDAICIDQNHAEKGHQVRNMDKVYRGQSLAIWLGEPSGDSDLAMDLIGQYAGLLGISQVPNVPLLHQRFEVFSMSTPVPVWRALYNLISRPWFTRRWIIQEFALSTEQYLWVGDRNQNALFLSSLALWLGTRRLYVGEEATRETQDFCQMSKCDKHSLQYDDIGPLERIRRLGVAQLLARGNMPGLTLERLLDDFSSFKSFDLRDGIYAFLSMASDVDTSKWLPDYSSNNNPVSLCGKVVLHTLHTSGSLDMICHCMQGLSCIRACGVPSWIPWFGIVKVTASLRAVGCRIIGCTKEDHKHRTCVHEVSGYKARSLTTWGQPLKRLKRGQEGWIENVRCGGCKEYIMGTGLRCLRCDDFDFCHICAGKSDSIHDPNHYYRIPQWVGVLCFRRNFDQHEATRSGVGHIYRFRLSPNPRMHRLRCRHYQGSRVF